MGRRRKKKDKYMIVDRESKTAVIFCKYINTCRKSCKKYTTWLNRGYCLMCVRQNINLPRDQLLGGAREVCELVRKLGYMEEDSDR